MTDRIAFRLNGSRVVVETDPMRRLADVLRYDLGLTATQTNCTVGDCGGCLVRVDGREVASCRVAVAQVEDSEVVTVEEPRVQAGS